MFGKLVVAHLLKLDRTVTLRRPPSPAQADPGLPAALVLPRGGRVRDPHLMLISGGRTGCGPPADTLVFADAHAVATVGNVADRRRSELADVLVVADPLLREVRADLAGLLGRYPGCAVVVGQGEGGSLVCLRDGPMFEISGGPETSTDTWPAFYGSLVYAWASAELPVLELTMAVVITGTHVPQPDGGTGVLEMASRIRFQVIDSPVPAARQAERAS